MEGLTKDVLRIIFNYFHPFYSKILRLVCKNWYYAINKEQNIKQIIIYSSQVSLEYQYICYLETLFVNNEFNLLKYYISFLSVPFIFKNIEHFIDRTLCLWRTTSLVKFILKESKFKINYQIYGKYYSKFRKYNLQDIVSEEYISEHLKDLLLLIIAWNADFDLSYFKRRYKITQSYAEDNIDFFIILLHLQHNDRYYYLPEMIQRVETEFDLTDKLLDNARSAMYCYYTNDQIEFMFATTNLKYYL